MLRSAQVNSPIYRDFKGGLNIRDAAHVIKDNEATDAQNVYFNAEGGIQRRGGWSKLATNAVGTASNLIGVHQAAWVETGVIVRKVIATDGVTVFRLDNTTWTDITGSVTRSVSASTLESFIEFNNLCIMYDGSAAPCKIAGSSSNLALLGGSPPTGNIAVVWQSRLFWAGVSTAQTRLYYSDVGDPETYGGTSYIDIPSPFDGDPITGLAILYGNLIVFKRYSIYVISGSGPSDWVVSKTNSSIGCVSPYSVLAVNNLIYFVSDKGLYAMNLSNSKQLCYKVEPRYNNAVRNQLLNGSINHNRIQALHYRKKNQVWMAVDASASGQDTHDRVMVHDYVITDEAGDPAASEHIVGANLVNNSLLTCVVNAGGSGYAVGDRLTINGGNSDAVVTVATLSGSAVATVTITTAGTGYSAATGATSTKITGVGSGATFNTTVVNCSRAPACWADYIDSTGDIVPIAGFYSKFVYVYNDATLTDTDNLGTSRYVIVKWSSKYFDFGEGFAQKLIRWLRTSAIVSGGSPKVIITRSNDIGVSSTATTLSSLSFNARTGIPAASAGYPSLYWKVGFQSDDGGLFTLYQFGLDLIWKGRRN
jgi:hypothetical protein